MKFRTIAKYLRKDGSLVTEPVKTKLISEKENLEHRKQIIEGFAEELDYERVSYNVFYCKAWEYYVSIEIERVG